MSSKFQQENPLSRKNEARVALSDASQRAKAKALQILAARECPPDVAAFGEKYDIKGFAVRTWQAGFKAGMRTAMLKEQE